MQSQFSLVFTTILWLLWRLQSFLKLGDYLPNGNGRMETFNNLITELTEFCFVSELTRLEEPVAGLIVVLHFPQLRVVCLGHVLTVFVLLCCCHCGHDTVQQLYRSCNHPVTIRSPFTTQSAIRFYKLKGLKNCLNFHSDFCNWVLTSLGSRKLNNWWNY